MNRLKKIRDNLTVYDAGIPNFPNNFARDGILSSILLKDPVMLKEQLLFCKFHQGIKSDPYTGEEHGKIFHEFPKVTVRDLCTQFNACDTTSLYLIGHEKYISLTNDKTLALECHNSIQNAIKYIQIHMQDGLFIEDPKYSNAREYALKVTYWKDSCLIGRYDGEPSYPITYTLAHIQSLRALRSALFLTNQDSLKTEISNIKNSLENLFDFDSDSFCIGVDKLGMIKGLTSDTLHALYYLETDDISYDLINKILISSIKLETKAGYRTMEESLASKITDSYHSKTVWPFEQAFIHIGASKFLDIHPAFKHIQDISIRCMDYMDTNPEILNICDDGTISKGGCDPQLWSIAAKDYFSKV